MPDLADINAGALHEDDTKKQVESVVSQLNEWGRQISNENKTLIRKDASGTQRILLGEGANSFYGMKVSKPGFDVYTAADSDLIFNSGQNVLKVASILTGTVSIVFAAHSPGGSGTFSLNSTNTLPLAHGLTTAPQVLVSIYDSVSSKYSPISNGTLIQQGGIVNPQVISTATPAIIGTCSFHWQFDIDTTNVTIYGIRRGGQATGTTFPSITVPDVTFKVYCLQETAS